MMVKVGVLAGYLVLSEHLGGCQTPMSSCCSACFSSHLISGHGTASVPGWGGVPLWLGYFVGLSILQTFLMIQMVRRRGSTVWQLPE
jgi:hypothetical protein